MSYLDVRKCRDIAVKDYLHPFFELHGKLMSMKYCMEAQVVLNTETDKDRSLRVQTLLWDL